MIMNCTDVEKEIELYVLGGTEAAVNRQIEQHLRGCQSCRRLQRECEDILFELKANGQALCDKAALMDEIRSANQPLLRRTAARRRFLQFASIAAVFVLVATIWFVGPGDERSPTPDQSTAPNKTVWRKAATVATGATEADDIVIHDGTIFLLLENDSGQTVSAVEADSGRTLWQSELVSCGYLAADHERVYCVALEDQARLHLCPAIAFVGCMRIVHMRLIRERANRFGLEPSRRKGIYLKLL
jgi:hypothetical protein